MNAGSWFRRNASTILTCLGAGGFVATVVLAIKATPRAHDKIVDAKADKAQGMGRADLGSPKLTVLETVRACGKEYIPTAAVGTASLACIFGANALNRRQQESMAAAYAALAGAFEGYREKVRHICGPETDATIEKSVRLDGRDAEDDHPPWDEVQTFYIECCDKPAFFERTMEQILKAEYEANRLFAINGEITLNEFLEILDLDPVDGGDAIGWETYIGESRYGYRWIDFDHRYFTVDGGLTVCSIDMPFGPHSLFEEDCDWQLAHLRAIADESK